MVLYLLSQNADVEEAKDGKSNDKPSAQKAQNTQKPGKVDDKRFSPASPLRKGWEDVKAPTIIRSDLAVNNDITVVPVYKNNK